MTSVQLRIVGVAAWSFEDNECTVLVSSDDATCDGRMLGATLPPIAAPSVLYHANVDPVLWRITRWDHEPARLDPDDSRILDALATISNEQVTAAALALHLDKEHTRENVFAAAKTKDVQNIPNMGIMQCIFDGLALDSNKKQRLLENHAYFGRSERRCLKRPHTVAFPGASDTPDTQYGDFSRSADPELVAASRSRFAWTSCRHARNAFVNVTQEMVSDVFGEDTADMFEKRGLLPLTARQQPTKTTDAVPKGLLFSCVGLWEVQISDKPPTNSKTTHWFAACLGSAQSHHKGESPCAGSVGYGVHELEGTVFVTRVTPHHSECLGGKNLSSGGLTMLSQIPVSEGGTNLFRTGSLESVGFYCPRGNVDVWTTSTIKSVLMLVKPGGIVKTNAPYFEVFKNVL